MAGDRTKHAEEPTASPANAGGTSRSAGRHTCSLPPSSVTLPVPAAQALPPPPPASDHTKAASGANDATDTASASEAASYRTAGLSAHARPPADASHIIEELKASEVENFKDFADNNPDIMLPVDLTVEDDFSDFPKLEQSSLWSIWKLRNEIYFQGKKWTGDRELLGRIARTARTWRVLCKVEDKEGMERLVLKLEHKAASPLALLWDPTPMNMSAGETSVGAGNGDSGQDTREESVTETTPEPLDFQLPEEQTKEVQEEQPQQDTNPADPVSYAPETLQQTVAATCQRYCGGVEIPYPFGIGRGCYHRIEELGDDQQDFKVNCSNHNADGVRLQKPTPMVYGFEVLRIDVALGKLTVRSPVSSWCYNAMSRSMGEPKETWYESTALRISDADNVLAVVGCNAFAFLGSREGGGVLGCQATCPSGRRSVAGGFSACNGTDGCCQTAIPPGMRSFDLFFSEWYNNSGAVPEFNPCSYAMVVDKEAFKFGTSYVTTRVSRTQIIDGVIHGSLQEQSSLGRKREQR
ncbi:hypothetical protein EJB05_01020, partial [Eragrostis curvula]